MRKLRLDLDELAVQSFATGETEGGRGTVAAQEVTVLRCNDTGPTGCDINTCPLSCDGACGSYYCPPVGDLSENTCVDGSALCTFAYGTGCVYA
jgi:hypothetical protein